MRKTTSWLDTITSSPSRISCHPTYLRFANRRIRFRAAPDHQLVRYNLTDCGFFGNTAGGQGGGAVLMTVSEERESTLDGGVAIITRCCGIDVPPLRSLFMQSFLNCRT